MIAAAFLLLGALLLPAGAAWGGAPTNVSDRLDGDADCQDEKVAGANVVTVSAVGTLISAGGQCNDASGITIDWLTDLPAKTKADTKKIRADQKRFTPVTFFVPASASGAPADETGTAIIRECKAKGSFNGKKFRGRAAVNCRLSDSLDTQPPLSPEAIAAILLAYDPGLRQDCKITASGNLRIRNRGLCSFTATNP